MHAILDVAIVDIHLFADPNPWVPMFPQYGNTDAYGVDYTPLPTMVYDFNVRDAGVTIASDTTPIAAGSYYTFIAAGSVGAGTIDPLLGPGILAVVDDLSSAPAGEHRLTVFHTATGVGMLNLSAGVSAAGVGYQSFATLTVPAGSTVLGIDFDGDNLVDLNYSLTLADGGWSYLYLLPDPLIVGKPGVALHHVRNNGNIAVIPTVP